MVWLPLCRLDSNGEIHTASSRAWCGFHYGEIHTASSSCSFALNLELLCIAGLVCMDHHVRIFVGDQLCALVHPQKQGLTS